MRRSHRKPDRHREFEALFRACSGATAVAAADGEDDEETQVKEDGGGEGGTACPPKRAFPAASMASPTETLAARHFPHEDTALTRLRRCLPAAIPKRRSFRNVARASRGSPDLRRSLRVIVRADGDVLRIRSCGAGRQVQRKLLVLIDISGSMKLHTAGIFGSPTPSCRNADRAEVFTLRHPPHPHHGAPAHPRPRPRARARRGDGRGLGRRHAHRTDAARLLSVPRFAAFARGAAVVILSDGLERGDHAEMETAFRRLKARAFRLSLADAARRRSALSPGRPRCAPSCRYLDDLVDGSRYRRRRRFHAVARPAGAAAARHLA